MNGKIDENGLLHIERKGRFVKAWCHKHDCYCGDRCHYFVDSEYENAVYIYCVKNTFEGQDHMFYQIIDDLRGEE